MRSIAIAVLMLLLSSLSNIVQADVTSSLSGSPLSIVEGQSASFNAVIQDTGPPSGYDSESISSISYTFGSGDGQTSTGLISGLNTASYSLSDSFTYLTSGTYTPWFNANVTTSDPYHYTQWSSYWVYSGYQTCGWLGCWWVDTSHWQNYSYTAYSVAQINWNTSAQTNLEVTAAVPEPESYAMMLAGLGLLGFMARRRKQKEAACA